MPITVPVTAGSTVLAAPAVIAPPGPAPRRYAFLAVLAATLLFGAFAMVFAINTPPNLSPDEPQQVDRVIASAYGDLVPDPGGLRVSTGITKMQRFYNKNNMVGSNPKKSWADYTAEQRADRPSFAELGGNVRSPTTGGANYMTQHPPLYYAVMGGLTWLIPSFANINGDTLLLLLRFWNIMLMLPVPYLLYRAARTLFGRSPVSVAVAFTPLLVPGLLRSAGSVNNDNLAIVLGCAVLALALAVARGDLSVRTASWLAGCCVAGSLTKGTLLIVLLVVPVAYLIGALRSRAWPDGRALLILGIGALGSATWWVRNYLAFAKVQPDGFGDDAKLLSAALGPARPAGRPVEYDYFFDTVQRLVPGRFWGALGLLEPPALPSVMVRIATAFLVVAIAVTLVVLARRRWAVALAVLAPTVATAAMLLVALAHFRHFTSLSGLQGRYIYPGVLGFLLPMVVLGTALLGRFWKWIPVLILGVGLLVSGWGVYTSVQFYWLHRGQELVPGDWAQAARALISFAPFPAAVTLTLLVLSALAMAGGVAGTVLLTLRNGSTATLRTALADPEQIGDNVPKTPVDDRIPAGALS